MTELAAASFPVVFFDGDREIDMGTVAVHPSLWFKKFQTLIGQKIGIAPHRISTSLVRRKKARPSPEIRRRVPIDESSDFAAIARERDCFVLAVLRRSRRDRRVRRVVHPGPDGGGAPEKTILRRNPEEILVTEAAVGMGMWDYESQLMNLQRQREQYLLSTAACYPYPVVGEDGYMVDVRRRTAAGPRAAAAVCEVCLAARDEGRTPPFHWCVHDAVTEGFRSRVGPIQRPPKKHAQASA